MIFRALSLTVNRSINPEGDIAGFYIDTSNLTYSFLLSHGVYTSFDPPAAVISEVDRRPS